MGSWIVKAVLDWVADFIGNLVSIFKRDKANQEAQKTQADKDTKPASELKPDSKPDEVSSAIDDELSHM